MHQRSTNARVNSSRLTGICCAVIAIAGCAPTGTVAKKAQPTGAVKVKTVSVAQTDVQRTTKQPASIHAFYRAEVRAKTSGFVKEVLAEIGDYVKADARLAIIDVPEMEQQQLIAEARIRRAEAEERRTEAGMKLAAAGVQLAKAKVAEAESMITGIEATLAAAQSEFDRTEMLVSNQSLQASLLDEARKNRDSQLASRDAIESSVEAATAAVAVAEAKERSAKADLSAAKADTEIARSQLEELIVLMDYTTIKAPFSGVVTQRNIEPGDLVRNQSEVGDGKPLYVISRVDKLRVRITVPETDAPLVSQGDVVKLTFPSFAAESPIATTITRVSGNLDPSSRTMLVEAELPNPDGKLLPGMFGQATINLSTKVAANMLPARAIRFDEAGEAYVYVLSQDDTVSVAQVTTGMDNGNSIEVLSGIEPDQRVIDTHLKRFTDGQKVAVLAN